MSFILCLALLAALDTSLALAGSSGETSILYQNDGNWTRHDQNPSAVFFNVATDYEAAKATCVSNNETLLNCHKFSELSDQFSYQRYLGNLGENQLLWSSCSSSSPSDQNGGLPQSGTGTKYPFLCTNSASLVQDVYTDFSAYPRINTTVNGTTFEGIRDHMAFRFIGVPFAKPPVKDLRFRYAQNWEGTHVQATNYSNGCLQYGWFEGDTYGLNPWGNSEDCLYLNVYTSTIPELPLTDESQLKPVMFWFYGGGQTTGTASDSTFDGASIVSRGDVVLVTANYRLNIFGYMGLNDSIIPGNYALTDKIVALEWVQKYIRGFGGNPNNVTIFGQSAGGGSCIDLVTSPKAKSLFSGAIQQSAGRGHDTTPNTAAGLVLSYLDQYCYGANGTGEARLKCLQALPAETLLNITYSEVTTWQTIVDGIYVPDMPISQVAKGAAYVNPVKLMSTFMPEEAQSLLETLLAPNMTNFTANLWTLEENGQITAKQVDEILASNLWLITNETIPNNGSTTYPNAYNASINVATDAQLACFSGQYATLGTFVAAFDPVWAAVHQRGYGLSYYDYYDLCTFPVGKPETPYYRCHSSDLYEIFGTYYLFNLPVRVPEDIYYTNAVQDMWTSFARTGNPNVEKDYLKARGYNTTLRFFENWSWPQFEMWDQSAASIQWPDSGYTALPSLRHCKVIVPELTL
ncbi:carboxylesterase [Penicillium angulare]|uniref:carboxylesterase n=1 Tax=Penicillium angulare TaxID=116970 RepID=UPI00254097A2|nr:carboxylesterase [Penicillium angulare]KAJ5287618.1 carboxylesterase [Penicillium angulare]